MRNRAFLGEGAVSAECVALRRPAGVRRAAAVKRSGSEACINSLPVLLKNPPQKKKQKNMKDILPHKGNAGMIILYSFGGLKQIVV